MKTSLWMAALCAVLLAPMARAADTMPVTAPEIAAVKQVIRALYTAYTKRDLDGVLALEKDAIDRWAAEYERKHGSGKGEVYRTAFREDTADIIHHKDFRMRPLHLDDVQFRRSADGIEVSSAVPIIATNLVEVGSGVDTQKVRLRFGRFVLARTGSGAGFHIVKMDLY